MQRRTDSRPWTVTTHSQLAVARTPITSTPIVGSGQIIAVQLDFLAERAFASIMKHGIHDVSVGKKRLYVAHVIPLDLV
jgi:hypothetical protein